MSKCECYLVYDLGSILVFGGAEILYYVIDMHPLFYYYFFNLVAKKIQFFSVDRGDVTGFSTTPTGTKGLAWLLWKYWVVGGAKKDCGCER